MAIAAIGTGGIGGNRISASSLAFSTATNTINASDNRFAVLTVIKDNVQTTSGSSNEVTSVTGGNGTWTKLGEYTNGNGGAAAGVTTALFLFNATGDNAIGTALTITFSSSIVDKGCSLHVFSKGAGATIALDTEPATNPIGNEVDAANDFGSVSFSGLSSRERLYFRGLGKEANTLTPITVTSGFTNIAGLRTGNVTDALALRGEFRVNTSTGETSNPTLAVSGDTAGLFAALVEIGPLQTLTPDRFDNANQFFPATLVQAGGAQTLIPARFDNADEFFAATILRGAVALTPARFDDADEFYAATVSSGPVVLPPQTLTPALFENVQQFSAASLALAMQKVTISMGRGVGGELNRVAQSGRFDRAAGRTMQRSVTGRR